MFADLSGFTRLTEEQGDDTAARFAAGLARVADRIAGEHRGRLVKQLGDGVMLAFQHVGDALRAAFALRASAADSGLPDLHIGIAAGPVVERDGDYFGRTVNLSSRLSGVAGPGEVVVDAVTASHAPDVTVSPLGARELKGLPRPVPVFRLDGTGTSADGAGAGQRP
jgi:adenylate cyclase